MVVGRERAYGVGKVCVWGGGGGRVWYGNMGGDGDMGGEVRGCVYPRTKP